MATLHISIQYLHVAAKPQAAQEFNAICHSNIFAYVVLASVTGSYAVHRTTFSLP